MLVIVLGLIALAVRGATAAPIERDTDEDETAERADERVELDVEGLEDDDEPASHDGELHSSEADMKLSANAQAASGVEPFCDEGNELGAPHGTGETLLARDVLAFTSPAGFADAAELFDADLRHQRPSRWGRIDLAVTWRRALEQPASASATRADELWLIVEWTR